MMKKILFLTMFMAMGSSSSRAMELPTSNVLSLKNTILMQLAQESDVEILHAVMATLHNDLAFQLLSNILAFNFDLYPFAKCELIADFRARQGLSVRLSKHLEALERQMLLGGRVTMESST